MRWSAAILLVVVGIYGRAEASEQLDALRSEALALVNESRREEGMPALEIDQALTQAAQTHAEDMLRKGYFAHQSPTGQSVQDRYRAYGGTAPYVAENIAQCRNCRPDREQLQQLHQGWMNSPGHRANILSPGIQKFGFGLVAGGSTVYAVETFAGPGASSAREGKPIDAAGQLALALNLINHERQRTTVAALEGSQALSQALTATIDRMGMQIEDLPPVKSVIEALPQEQLGGFGKAAIIAAECEACGARPTDADVQMFVDRWLHDPHYRAILLDADGSHLGLAMKADGTGRKLVLACIASSR